MMQQKEIGQKTEEGSCEVGESTLDTSNLAFRYAVDFVNQTNRTVFLTGKAGTGKTTFLRYIRAHSHKKMVIAAPTGVAAMNAGGMTLHSLFWLPFGLYMGDMPADPTWESLAGTAVYNRSRLFGKVKLTARKRALLREIDLLVIDEVSMVRADVLDAVDALLRSVRRDARPFGGLQVLLIGDLFQLPPVVKEEEWRVMKRAYPSPFFFDAKVLAQQEPVALELNRIYRQTDPSFIEILNAIRSNSCTPNQLNFLNSFYRPDFAPEEGKSYITLTSHNRRADEINTRELEALAGKATTLSARIKGDFSLGLFPADDSLTLKPGAQVMFIRNDSGEDRRYYNGKIGKIQRIDSGGDRVTVEFGDGTEPVEVKRETWENIRYDYDKDKDRILENVLGTFSQFPLRLAWAITIHKSQGLTFERAIIDAGASFAPGQVYVALSRLTSLEGLVLKSIIGPMSIRTDPAVQAFSERFDQPDALPTLLAESQRDYLGHLLIESFKWEKLTRAVSLQLEELEHRQIPNQAEAYRFLQILTLAVYAQEEVAAKFRQQLRSLLSEDGGTDYEKLRERTRKAVDWFRPRIDAHLLTPLLGHMDEWKAMKRTKRYIQDLLTLSEEFRRKRDQLQHCLEIAENLAKNVSS